jgi:hypothetical protein
LIGCLMRITFGSPCSKLLVSAGDLQYSGAEERYTQSHETN